ncbi:MAG: IclR family transcriptional regulator [Desulfobacterales bacterium]|nr:MAG: IclR family transcriptional regulator [Desulfobacterales bacterium]
MARIRASVRRALEVLELFLDGTRSISVPEIVARLGLPRTTAHELVQTLLASGYLTQVEDQSYRFTLGFRVFELGSAYAGQFDLAAEGQKVALKVSKTCDETVQMAIRDGTEAVFIAKVDSARTVRLVSAVGSRLPAHCTAVGKMLLSVLSDEELLALYPDAERLPGMTVNSITSLKRLRYELAEIRKHGLAYDDCESNADVRCVAAPIYNHNGKMVAAMSISVPIMRMSASRQEELAALVRRGAEDLSRRLGYGMSKLDPHWAEF